MAGDELYAAPEEEQLESTDIKVGSGPEVERGDEVTVSYVGKLDDEHGFQFDAAKKFSFTVGAGDGELPSHICARFLDCLIDRSIDRSIQMLGLYICVANLKYIEV